MAQHTRTPESRKVNSGIYLGKVVNHLDTQYMGTLEVELLKAEESGNFANYIQCKYASPFQGATPYSGVTNNGGYDYTQKSYGFWAVPPDIGTLVIVVMPEGNFGNAYWIGCVADLGMNFMTPGYASTTFNDNDKSIPLPVGEYNKRVETGAGTDPTKYLKPANTKAIEALEAQGLKEDHIRGTNTSSARREVPSMVFGISTPGPQDRSGPTHRYGKPGGTVNAAFSRLGGSSFVMDDGDMSLLRKGPSATSKLEYASVEEGETDGDNTLPANELIRIKTRTGHQILLHNTEDLIYISHGSGNSWIEMTANGKIDIYAKDSISVHSENDINFKADRDINFQAGNNFNFTAGKSFFLSAAENWEISAGTDGKLKAGSSTNISTKTHSETAPSGIYMNSSSSAAAEAAEASVPKRVPQHEPWSEHENLNPETFLPDQTVASDPSEQAPAETEFVFPPIPDTFKKPT